MRPVWQPIVRQAVQRENKRKKKYDNNNFHHDHPCSGCSRVLVARRAVVQPGRSGHGPRSPWQQDGQKNGEALSQRQGIEGAMFANMIIDH